MATKKAAARSLGIEESTEEKRDHTPSFFYVCGHSVSNDPCSTCQPGQPKMPKDWQDGYEAPGEPGTTDRVK